MLTTLGVIGATISICMALGVGLYFRVLRITEEDVSSLEPDSGYDISYIEEEATRIRESAKRIERRAERLRSLSDARERALRQKEREKEQSK